MRRSNIPQVITSLDLAVLYGIRKASYKSRFRCWCEDHLGKVTCVVGILAVIGIMWYMALLWMQGII